MKSQDLREPIIIANILLPPEHVGAVMKLCTEKRGKQIKMLYVGNQVRCSTRCRWPRWCWISSTD